MRRRRLLALAVLLSLGLPASLAGADWSALRGSVDRSGFVPATLDRPLRLLWAREFFNERLGTAMEPILAGGKLFVATHAGNLYACDAVTGAPIWRFEAGGPFLHSPATANGVVVAASVDGFVHGVAADSGASRWSAFIGKGGASASPMIVGGRIFICSWGGGFFFLGLGGGGERGG